MMIRERHEQLNYIHSSIQPQQVSRTTAKPPLQLGLGQQIERKLGIRFQNPTLVGIDRRQLFKDWQFAIGLWNLVIDGVNGRQLWATWSTAKDFHHW